MKTKIKQKIMYKILKQYKEFGKIGLMSSQMRKFDWENKYGKFEQGLVNR